MRTVAGLVLQWRMFSVETPIAKGGMQMQVVGSFSVPQVATGTPIGNPAF